MSEAIRKSRIRLLRRALLRLAMWRDPEARFPSDMQDGEEMVRQAKDGILEAEIYLERAYYARRYLVGGRP